jgi:hypothetical protein
MRVRQQRCVSPPYVMSSWIAPRRVEEMLPLVDDAVVPALVVGADEEIQRQRRVM